MYVCTCKEIKKAVFFVYIYNTIFIRVQEFKILLLGFTVDLNSIFFGFVETVTVMIDGAPAPFNSRIHGMCPVQAWR